MMAAPASVRTFSRSWKCGGTIRKSASSAFVAATMSRPTPRTRIGCERRVAPTATAPAAPVLAGRCLLLGRRDRTGPQQHRGLDRPCNGDPAHPQLQWDRDRHERYRQAEVDVLAQRVLTGLPQYRQGDRGVVDSHERGA